MMVSFVHAQMEHAHAEEYTSDINMHLTGETFGCYCLAIEIPAHLEQRKSGLHLGTIQRMHFKVQNNAPYLYI